MSVRDTNGWTWGGVLKGVAYVATAAVVSFAVWTGAAMAVGAWTGNLAAGSTAASMVGLSTEGITNATGAIGGIWDIPGKFAGFLQGALFGTAEVAIKAANSTIVEPAVGAIKQAGSSAAKISGAALETVTSKATEYAVPAAAAAGGAVVAGAYMYGKGKDAGVKQAVGKFTQGELERRAHANIAQGQGI